MLQFSSISKLMLQRLQFVARLPLRAYRGVRRTRRLRSVERALHRAWPETKGRVELPQGELSPARAAYWSARRELDVWAWTHGVPFVPFSPYRSSVVEEEGDDGEGVLCPA